MLPIYLELKKQEVPTLLCSTGQHAELLDDVFQLFGVKPDFSFQIMKPDQDLFYITETVLEKSKELLQKVHPALVLVQGDTTSAMAAALASFYLKIPVAHVEAGLRTGKLDCPFPEELNRRMITLVSSVHFAPTAHASAQLAKEGVSLTRIFCTGNTVVDALYLFLDKMGKKELLPSPKLLESVEKQKSQGHKILLLTAHRRESFDRGLASIFSAIKKALELSPNLHVIYPVHPNPTIQKILKSVKLSTSPNIEILPPLSYQDLVYLLNEADVVATDSGGIQEEAASLNKPTLVLRNETDRPEGLREGLLSLVGTDESKILSSILLALKEPVTGQMRQESPYGDGTAARRIVSVIKKMVLEK
jgi:UDP-N-acetylglucosamine 2-epimerase (non-hydrolysing)